MGPSRRASGASLSESVFLRFFLRLLLYALFPLYFCPSKTKIIIINNKKTLSSLLYQASASGNRASVAPASARSLATFFLR